MTARATRHPRTILIRGERDEGLALGPRPLVDDLALRDDVDALVLGPHDRGLPEPAASLLMRSQFLAGAEV